MKQVLLYVCVAMIGTATYAQVSNQAIDSLQLQQIVQDIIKTHPSIKEASEALAIAEAKIALAKSEYLPVFYADASYAYMRTSWINLGGAKFDMNPANAYGAALNYNQELYNFGKTEKSVELAQESKNLVNGNVLLLKQMLTLASVNSFYMLYFIQEALQIKAEQIQTLKEHINFLEKKNATGSATKYELLSTKVKLATIENQKLDLETSQKVQSSLINSLLGKTTAQNITVKAVLSGKTIDLSTDSLLNKAYTQRAEVQIAKEKETLAQLQYQVTKAQNYPSLAAFASSGWKDGYFEGHLDDLSKPTFNYVIGVGVKVPLFDGFRKKDNLAIAQSSINNYSSETDLAKRTVSNEVIENQANCENAQKKVSQFELQVEQAKEAYDLAKVNFTVGAITNLDLLDAETALSESKLYLLKSKIDCEVNFIKLRIALGEQF